MKVSLIEKNDVTNGRFVTNSYHQNGTQNVEFFFTISAFLKQPTTLCDEFPPISLGVLYGCSDSN